jgi:nucleoside-diphosphate-sugar epimerase
VAVNYPLTPYAISKRAAEDYALFYGAAVVRFCNLYGAGGHGAIDRFRDGDRIEIRGSGEQLRTYAPVEDAVRR